MKVLLASASPRRRDLLRQIGWEAVIRPVDFAERQAGDPDAVCLGNARGKAADAAADRMCALFTRMIESL